TAYLQQSSGPLRPLFLKFVDDPDGLQRLTHEKALQRLDDRYAVLAEHYGLTDQQREEVKASNKFKAHLGAIFADPDFKKQLDDYKKLLDEVKARERALGGPAYNKERLVFDYGKMARAREALLARVEAPQKQMEEFLVKRLTPEQMATPDGRGKGPAPKEKSQTAFSDFANMWALTLVGVCLMLGLFTRLSALGGVGLLCMYYFAMPPWPGLPESPMAEGHYWIVNKNLIEAIALLMIATSGVGRWAGLDAYLSAGCRRRAGGAPRA
ncbi:MAG: DoxX family protein, partial [Alphaproteobacteria bacterium]